MSQRIFDLGCVVCVGTCIIAAVLHREQRCRAVAVVALLCYGTALCGWALDAVLLRFPVGGLLTQVLGLSSWFGMDLTVVGPRELAVMHSDGLLRFRVESGMLASGPMLTFAGGLLLAGVFGLRRRPMPFAVLAAAVAAMVLHAWVGAHLLANGEDILAGKGLTRLRFFQSPTLQLGCAVAVWFGVSAVASDDVRESCN